MPLTSSIVSYDPKWPHRYEAERKRLVSIFGTALIEIHHVGSTAVPGLAAKPEIDILIVVNEPDAATDCTAPLAEIGYRRGGDLSKGHSFFKRDVKGVRTHKLHVCREGHEQVPRMIKFRDLLCTNEDVREQYQTLKLKLERENTLGISEYLREKAPFIESVLARLKPLQDT